MGEQWDPSKEKMPALPRNGGGGLLNFQPTNHWHKPLEEGHSSNFPKHNCQYRSVGLMDYWGYLHKVIWVPSKKAPPPMNQPNTWPILSEHCPVVASQEVQQETNHWHLGSSRSRELMQPSRANGRMTFNRFGFHVYVLLKSSLRSSTLPQTSDAPSCSSMPPIQTAKQRGN